MNTAGPQDVYGLSPLQEGFLFHALYAPESGRDVMQCICRIPAALDPAALRAGCAHVVARHSILRTSFHAGGEGAATQRVHAAAELQWDEHDWRGLSPAGREGRLDAYLRADRVRGFEVERPPLLRAALFREGDAEWRLLWTMHHLVLDGRSYVVALREALAAADALERGDAPALPPPARPYRDFVRWMEARDGEASAAFWRQALAGFAGPAALPEDGPGGEPGEGLERFALGAEATEALRALAAACGVTLGTVAQAAWALLLARLGGTDDVAFGVTATSRHWAGAEAGSLVGMYLNTLPLRVRVPENGSVRDWLREVRGRALALRPHDTAPLARVQEWSGLPRGVPLFDTLLNFDHATSGAAVREAGGRWAGCDVEVRGQTGYALLAGCFDGPALRLELHYDRARFTGERVRRIGGWMLRLLDEIAARPDAPVGTLALADAEEVRTAGEDAAGDADGAGDDALLHVRFAAHARTRPAAPALRFSGRTWTYGEADAAAGHLAARLRGLGVGPEVRVAVCLERGAEAAIAFLAILRAGGVYLPLDPEYPAARLRYVVQDAGAAILIAPEALLSRFEGTALHTLCLPAGGAGAADGAPPVLDAGPAAADMAAYVIYTSGSTGRPKGVAVTHRGLANLVRQQERVLGAGPDARVLRFASPGFDASVFELAMALGTGGCLCGAADAAPGPELARRMGELEITHAVLTPSTLASLPAGAPLPALRTLMAAGEALPAELVERWAPGRRFWNLYGPTETTIWATAAPVRAGQGVPPIGHAIGGLRAYVLDGGLRPVPAGVGGELYVGGAGVARGYPGRPALTAERFLPDPFSPRPGARLYRTGDRARRRPDGALEFAGRTDEQVKVRGVRVEPGEVEAALAAHPGVAACAAAVHGTGEAARLAAYVVPAAGGEVPGAAELRAFLRGRLPEAMVPSAFVAMDALPRTAHGKLDRRALPAPGTPAGLGYAPPRTPLESALVRIWAEVLEVERVGIHDDFFDRGGHSLLATRAVSRIAAELGVSLPLRDLFDHPTPAAAAARVECARGAAADGPALHAAPRPADLLDALHTLSDDEVSALLARMLVEEAA